MRLTDVEELGLESEMVSVDNVDENKLHSRLRRNGATEEEIDFLLGDGEWGERVELNAMPSDVFVEFLEGKLAEHGITKVVPAKDRLDEAFELFASGERLKQAVEEIIAAHTAEDVAVPEDLEQRVKNYLEQNPEVPWAEAVRSVAESPS